MRIIQPKLLTILKLLSQNAQMINKIQIICLIIWVGVCVINAQDANRVLIADGNILQFGRNITYSDSNKEIFEFIKNTKVSAKTFGVDEKCYRSETTPNQPSDNISIYDSTEGFFTSKSVVTTAYLYYGCDSAINKKYSGIIILRLPEDKKSTSKPSFIANYQFTYKGETAIKKVEDLNGDGLDELAIFSSEAKNKKSFRLIEFTPKGIQSNSREIYNLEKTPAGYSKIFAEKTTQGSPKFFEESYTMTGKGWAKGSIQEIKLDADSTKFYGGGISSGAKILKTLIFLLFIVQLIAFIGLLGYLIYQFIKVFFEDSSQKEASKHAKEERKAGKSLPIIEDNLPRLDPINCQNCASPVPLQEGEMSCPGCGTKTKAPANYFDVAKSRQAIHEKLHRAEISFRRANWLVSGWMRGLMGLIPLVQIISMIAIFVWINKGTFEPFQNYLVGNSGFKTLFGFGIFSNLFWIVSFGFGFLIWSPSLRKALPTIESTESIGKAETARCSNCGGGISYQADDLATVCGYCGVEIYRAKLAWKMRNLTNNVHEKASFSLIEAQKAVEDAKWEITGTPIIFAALLLIIVVFAGVAFLISSLYEKLPSGIKDIFEFIGDILSLF